MNFSQKIARIKTSLNCILYRNRFKKNSWPENKKFGFKIAAGPLLGEVFSRHMRITINISPRNHPNRPVNHLVRASSVVSMYSVYLYCCWGGIKFGASLGEEEFNEVELSPVLKSCPKLISYAPKDAHAQFFFH